ncbi:putative mRNA 3'-end processing factor 3 [Methanocaldococcus villosus KIN24-T80]|uniref:Putative mRNA 3'-end processing factor 3 n=1 Tax=Methanocaldococcus villosus KIN24-T80 TaxID=1069083 RepID=N6VT34_9EURY|nr:MBL fold metallo-hydrolase RNA specificity domain-containing protein [Methanocaldococcus villosus]ENN96356.1 putative mRNA 3'-end processing factor 3 [Methanocaldococcus villosus KIN24-T80]
MVLLKFHGGCQEVGKSCVEVIGKEKRILLDCGASPNSGEIPNIENNLEVIVSHAHYDHCGAIPFYKFKKIYCTHPTADLMYITWKETLNISKAYKEEDIYRSLKSVETLNYYEEKDLGSLKFKLYNAGHILGSSSIYLEIDGKKILYTGDINEGPSRTVRSADTDIDEIDVLIIESTYGSPLDIKPSRKVLEKQLIEEVSETIEGGGKVIIPVFSVGRAQEILVVLNNYIRSGQLDAKIYTDGSLIHATGIYLSYKDWLNPKLKNTIESGINPFGDIKKADEKKVFSNEPCIIVSTSGMLQGGPVLKYLKLLKDEKNKLILTGHQAEGTLGKALEEGIREIKPFKNTIKIRGKVIKLEFSAHSDYNSLVRYIKKIPKPEKAIVMHGERYQSLSFAMTIWKTLKIPAYVPVEGTVIPL